MSKNKIINRKRRLEETVSLNKKIIDHDKSPHQRDEARCRISILKNAIKRLEEKLKSYLHTKE